MLTIFDVSANAYVQAAVESLDGYMDAMALVDAAQKALDNPPTAPDVPAKLDPFVSGKIEEAWIDAKLSRRAELARLEQRRAALQDFRHEAQRRAESLVATKLDTILGALNGELTKLLVEASKAAEQLGGARTAAEAVAANAAPAWKKLTALADDYERLRAGQQTVTMGLALGYWQSHDGRESHASDNYLANLDEVFPDWRDPGRGSGRVVHVDGRVHRYEPWPIDPVERLVWLVTSQAQPWIPTRAELDALYAERRRRRNPNPKPSTQPGPMLNKTPAPQYRRARVVRAAS